MFETHNSVREAYCDYFPHSVKNPSYATAPSYIW